MSGPGRDPAGCGGYDKIARERRAFRRRPVVQAQVATGRAAAPGLLKRLAAVRGPLATLQPTTMRRRRCGAEIPTAPSAGSQSVRPRRRRLFEAKRSGSAAHHPGQRGGQGRGLGRIGGGQPRRDEELGDAGFGVSTLEKASSEARCSPPRPQFEEPASSEAGLGVAGKRSLREEKANEFGLLRGLSSGWTPIRPLGVSNTNDPCPVPASSLAPQPPAFHSLVLMKQRSRNQTFASFSVPLVREFQVAFWCLLTLQLQHCSRDRRSPLYCSLSPLAGRSPALGSAASSLPGSLF